VIAAILDHLWQSTFIAVFIYVLALFLRSNSASVRYWLWFAASLKFLLPFSLLAALGRMTFTQPVSASSALVLSRIEPAATPFSAMPHAAAQVASAWPIVPMAVWLLGLLSLVGLWLVRWYQLSRTVRSATPCAFDTPVPVRSTPHLLEPGLVGVWRPVILLPEGIAGHLSRAEIDAIVTHELCHLRRRDNLFAMAHMLVEAIFWFYPLVWFIGARLVEEREHACDESVLACGKKPLEYAQAILKVCRLYVRSPLVCASGVSGANLHTRITAIMANRDIHDLDPGKVLLLASLGLFVVVTPFMTGGLKSVPATQLTHSIAKILLPVQQTEVAIPIAKPIAARPARALNRHRQPKTALAPAIPLRQDVSVTPAIAASTPVMAAPLPQVASSPADAAPAPEPVTSYADTIVCRPPQQLPTSRLLGPQVCLPKLEWDRMRKQGLELMPDGRTVAVIYEKQRSLSPRNCPSTPTGVSYVLSNFSANCF
jgi:beta-lactamase regulating signal transducer with metallopeptidase domain